MPIEKLSHLGSRALNPLRDIRFATHAAGSLFKDVPSNPSVKHRPFVKELAAKPYDGVLNTEAALPGSFISIVNDRGIAIPIENRRPYWLEDTKYRTLEVVGTSIQYFDQHGAPLPDTTIPPVEDVQSFIEAVLEEPAEVTVDRQFELLLDITDNNIVGAANLGMIANRHLSRYGDQRAYPNLRIGGNEYTVDTPEQEIYDLLAKWSDHLARFEVKHDPSLYEGRRDATGDSYYFWTHFFAAVMFGSHGIKSNAFKKGNELMIFARDYIGNRGGIVATHSHSSKIGRDIGLMLAE